MWLRIQWTQVDGKSMDELLVCYLLVDNDRLPVP